MILSMIGFLLGFAMGLFLYAQILLPLIYSLPLTIYYYFKREVTVGAIFFQFVPPLIWFFVITVVGLVLYFIAPTIFVFFVNDPGSILGRLAAIAALLLNFLRPKGRADMRSDYLQSRYARFATKV